MIASRSVIAAALFGALGACAQSGSVRPGADTGKIAETVRADVHQLVQEWNAHDAVKSVDHDEPDVLVMFHGEPNQVGRDADLAMTRQQFAAGPDAHITVKDEHVDVAAAGDVALYRASYVFTFTDPKTKKGFLENGNWLLGYRRQADGSWKVAWVVVSDTGAPPKAA